MTSPYLVHIDDVPVERQDQDQGWSISEFRLPLSRAQNSRTAVFHSRLRGGAAHKKHIHTECEEILYYVRGRAKGGLGSGYVDLVPGAYRLTPKSMEHWGWNSGESPSAEAVGFYVGAGSIEETGYVYTGEITEKDLTSTSTEFAHLAGIAGDTAPTGLSSGSEWERSEVRVLLSEKQGCTSTFYHARLLPGGQQHRHLHRACEEIYYFTGGRGRAGWDSEEYELREGHLLFVPQGAEHWLSNTSPDEPLEFLGLFTGVNHLDKTGLEVFR